MKDASPRARYAALLTWGMVVLLVVYLAGLLTHGPRFSTFVDGWLGTATQWAPAVVCAAAWMRARQRRPEIACATLAVALFAAGNTFYVLKLAHLAAPPVPSFADAGYLSFYPFALGAIAFAVRRELAGIASAAVWRDSVLSALAVTAGLAVALSPVMDAATHSTTTPAALTAIAYPIGDLLLISSIAGVCVLKGVRMQRHWLALVAGLLVFTASDVVYALRVVRGTYVVGTALDAGWAVGLALVAIWALRTGDDSEQRTPRGTLGVPMAATAIAMAVLVAGTQRHVSELAVSLASAVLALAAWRANSAFRELRRLAKVLRQVAGTDDLTGLANRRGLYAEVPLRLSATPDRAHSLILLDLDRFKEINDSLGHHVGDRLLVEIGTRLRSLVRPEDLVVRLGGDEFAVVLDDAGEAAAMAVADALKAAVSAPLAVEDMTVRCDVSIGIAVYPNHGRDVSALLRCADIAMYKSKENDDGPEVFSSADAQLGATRLRTVDDFRVALDRQQLILHYQPKLDLRTGDVTGVEALVRWQHPDRGLLYPDTFIEFVEEAGLMPLMTDQVLDQALDQAAAWRSAGRNLKVAVNLSARSLIDADLPASVAAVLSSHDVPPYMLQLEITESVLMSDHDRARAVLTELRDAGVTISVDDFGTGYSSLAYLRDLPIDELKLDQSFIAAMGADLRANALVSSTITLAHSLGLRMVAEGVDTEAALSELARYGCDEVQGYYISRPIPANDLNTWLDLHSPTSSYLRLLPGRSA